MKILIHKNNNKKANQMKKSHKHRTMFRQSLLKKGIIIYVNYLISSLLKVRSTPPVQVTFKKQYKCCLPNKVISGVF